MIQLKWNNIDEASAPVLQPKLNEELPEEGNYSRTVCRIEPRRLRRNNPDEEIEKYGCKYKDFMAFKPKNHSGSQTPVDVMD